MKTPLQPVWDVALKHWDEVIRTPADYAACVEEVSAVFTRFIKVSQWIDPWTDADILKAAFWHCGYKEIFGEKMGIQHMHNDIACSLIWRESHA